MRRLKAHRDVSNPALVKRLGRAIDWPVVEARNLTLAAPFLSEDFLRQASRVLIRTKPPHINWPPLVILDINGVITHAVSALDNRARIGAAITRAYLNLRKRPKWLKPRSVTATI